MSARYLTLSELSKRSGVEVRTLRSWIAQGVVPGAETVGRNARYPLSALTRAQAVRALRELYGLSLAQIRQDLLTADPARVEAFAAMCRAEHPPGAAPVFEDRGLNAAAAEPPPGSSAAAYLARRRGAGFAEPPAAPPFGSRLVRLVEGLERIAGGRLSRRKARGDVRLHIAITPDLEIVVRGDHAAEDIARFEQIADLLRDAITADPVHG